MSDEPSHPSTDDGVDALAALQAYRPADEPSSLTVDPMSTTGMGGEVPVARFFISSWVGTVLSGVVMGFGVGGVFGISSAEIDFLAIGLVFGLVLAGVAATVVHVLGSSRQAWRRIPRGHLLNRAALLGAISGAVASLGGIVLFPILVVPAVALGAVGGRIGVAIGMSRFMQSDRPVTATRNSP